jgi:shikimate kinase
MKLLFLFGDQAVGKMTVGQELAKITDLRLFHNHMTIEPVKEIFGKIQWETVYRLREVIFEDFSASDCYGLIFTYMMAFNKQSEWDYITHVADIFKKQNADIYYAELFAPLEVRMQRNTTENRLLHKPSKRNLEESSHLMVSLSEQFRCVSNDGEVPFENYVKIDNTNLPPDAAAKMIQERFLL